MLREKRPLADRCRVLATKEFSLEGGIRKYDSLYRSMASAAGNRVLFIVPYPSEGASNRLRVEQYLPYLDRDGIRYSVRPFVGKRFYRILYSRGRHFAKACFFALSIIGRCLDVLRALKYDIVFVHREALPIGSIAIEKAFLKTGRRMIFDFDDAIFLPSTSESNNYMERFKDPGKVARIIALSGHVIAGNGYLKEYAGKFNRNVTVIPTPIDADRYRPDAAAALRPDGAVTIGWIGSFTTRVYLDFLRGVFGRLKAKYPALRLIFVGNWSGMKDRIEWAEYKEWSLDDEPADIRSFDIGIMPMPDDMWTRGKCGFKIILYMSCSIPVVSSPVGVNLEIIKDKENGLLARTDEEWFMALSQLVEDATLRGRLGAAGRRTVEERYSVRRTAPLFISVLRETSGRCFEF
jgi:glycosyltransferase involved in cell wall biosynthesis